MADPRILVVGPFSGWDEIVQGATDRGWRVDRVESGAEAFRSVADPDLVAVVLPDEMRDGPAHNLVLRARAAGTRADFVVIAAGSRREDRASLLAEGVDEVFEDPADPDRVLAKIDRVLRRRRLVDDLDLVVHDPVMVELFERILRVAPLKVTILITGESGTGKEMLAQAVHRASDRSDGPFVAVNVGALPETLLESELFGHEKGAFTSADARRIGRFEMADGGTLFLDEIGEMSLASQVNLLRVLEDEEFLRLGASKKITVDVRIVAATNRNLDELVREGTFRRDLFYRLKVVHLDVPPLRMRRGEIAVLARELATRAARRHGVSFPGFTAEALDRLTEYEWPGNVRELRNLVDGLVALRPETRVRPDDLPPYVARGAAADRMLPALPPDRSEAEREFVIQSLLALRAELAALRELIISGGAGRRVGATSPYGAGPPAGEPVYPTGPVRVEPQESSPPLSLREVQRQAVERALRETGGNRRAAALMLGISERTLYRRLRDFGLADSIP